jgi:type IV fimbrial biogenesis protein FimT
LVELLVVIAIVGILAAMATPSFTQYSANKRMRALVSDFATSVRLTRSEALKRNRLVTMCRTTTPDNPAAVCAGFGDWHDGWMVFEDNANFGVRDATEAILNVQPAKTQNGTIVANGGGNYTISFTPMGTPRNLGIIQGMIFEPNLPNPDTSSVRSLMCINATGRVRVVVVKTTTLCPP